MYNHWLVAKIATTKSFRKLKSLQGKDSVMADSVDPVLVQKLNEIFFPHFWEKRLSLKESDRRLVHYTSAENALRILTDKAIVLRSTVCMNDYSEVQHGHRLVQRCFFENEN